MQSDRKLRNPKLDI